MEEVLIVTFQSERKETLLLSGNSCYGSGEAVSGVRLSHIYERWHILLKPQVSESGHTGDSFGWQSGRGSEKRRIHLILSRQKQELLGT